MQLHPLSRYMHMLDKSSCHLYGCCRRIGAAECEHHITLQESMDPANFNAARANYKRLMQCLQGMPGTPGTPLLQPGEASGPAASQPSMPAVSLTPPVTTAFGARVCSWPCTFTLYLNSC